MNVAVLVGRMVADPELKYTPSGIAVCSFRIAVDRPTKSESGEKQTDFLDIVAWRQSAEFVANYLTKGSLVAVNGSIQTRSWVQQDGQKRWKTEVVAARVQGLGGRPAGERQPEAGHVPGPEETPSETPPVGGPESESDTDYDPFAEE